LKGFGCQKRGQKKWKPVFVWPNVLKKRGQKKWKPVFRLAERLEKSGVKVNAFPLTLLRS
jgi:hypothetical protein